MLAAGLPKGSAGGTAMAVFGGLLLYRAATGYCEMYAALGLELGARGARPLRRPRPPQGRLRPQDVHHQPLARECYDFWRDFQNLPRFMTHLKSVSVVDATHSRWEARSPTGGTVAWDAEIIAERPNELISWKSVGDADIDNAGSVRFRPATGAAAPRSQVEIDVRAPRRPPRRPIARLLGEEPDHQVREDLRRFKQIMEAGETPTVHGQPACRGGGRD